MLCVLGSLRFNCYLWRIVEHWFMLRPAFAAPLVMLFKTLSASVYGIDAYLVEVEVDVGSARMTDFNVVGLPDNAVKESRDRIKSPLRNCGFQFPHCHASTINLPPPAIPQ